MKCLQAKAVFFLVYLKQNIIKINTLGDIYEWSIDITEIINILNPIIYLTSQ